MTKHQFINTMIAGALVGAGLTILVKSLVDVKISQPESLVKPQQAMATDYLETLDNDTEVLAYIRQTGNEHGATNQQILTMMAIARCESSLRVEAINKNRNGSIDAGIYQINSVHKHKLIDLLDPKFNITVAWRMWERQGTTPWRSSQKCWDK